MACVSEYHKTEMLRLRVQIEVLPDCKTVLAALFARREVIDDSVIKIVNSWQQTKSGERRPYYGFPDSLS